MPASTFEVPKGTKLEIVYWTIRTSSFSVSFQPDSGGQPQLLVSEINSETTVGESGEFIPFLLIKESGVLTMTTTGGTVLLHGEVRLEWHRSTIH
jgi:hypothetical protein